MIQDYWRLIDKANWLRDRTIWGLNFFNRTVKVFGVKADKKGIEIVSNIGDGKRKILKMGYDGKIRGYGIIQKPISNKIFSEKQIGFLNESIDLYKKAIEMYPNNFNAYKELGKLYSWIGLYDESLEYLKKAFNITKGKSTKEDIKYYSKKCLTYKNIKPSYFIVEKEDEKYCK